MTVKSCIEWVKVETATLLLFFKEMYVAEMTVHAKSIFINMHEYLNPSAPYNMGLICCNDTCMPLIGSSFFVCFYTSPGNTCSSPTLPSSLGGSTVPPITVSFPSKCKCNVIKERPLSTYTVLDGGCLFLLSPFLWSRNLVCSSLLGDR